MNLGNRRDWRPIVYRAGIFTGLMSDRLGNFNEGGQEIIQTCTDDDVTNYNWNNISPIWRRVFIYFRQIAHCFACSASGHRQREACRLHHSHPLSHLPQFSELIFTFAPSFARYNKLKLGFHMYGWGHTTKCSPV